jgi:hypothetical protein
MDAPPFFDVFHWLIRSHALLGHPSRRSLLRGLAGKGWVGSSLAAFAEGACLARCELGKALHDYLSSEIVAAVSPGYGASRISAAAQDLQMALGGSR